MALVTFDTESPNDFEDVVFPYLTPAACIGYFGEDAFVKEIFKDPDATIEVVF